MNKELLKNWQADVGTFCFIVSLMEILFSWLGITICLIDLPMLFVGYGVGSLGIALIKEYTEK